jgi:ferredoxin
MDTIEIIETDAELKKEKKSKANEKEKDNNEATEEECSIRINEECAGCTVCVDECPVNAISGEAGEKHEIDPGVCIECENCIDVCPKNSIIVDD